MSSDIQTLQEKMEVIRKNPSVFDIIQRHSGAKDLTDINNLETPILNRLKRYVEYYHGIVTCPA
ncbi:MAG: hypothetical protein HQL68_10540 [Magnetococcales bacterium]|nr:hypothetical protein [Magnetococcales bacterium]